MNLSQWTTRRVDVLKTISEWNRETQQRNTPKAIKLLPYDTAIALLEH